MKNLDTDLNRQLQLALEISGEAGNLLMDGFDKEKTIDRKSSAVDWVTEYDHRSEELIVEKILAANPDHGIMGEEGSRVAGAGRYLWYVDPLDGTTNYAHRFPMFCVSLGLYAGDDALAGVVHDPVRQETFFALKGGGAFLDTPTGRVPIQVSRASKLEESLLATGFPYDRHTSRLNNVNEFGHFLVAAQGIRRAGAAALDLCYVASGRLDAYWEFKLHAWDMAAGRLIVEEAGGTVTNIDGTPVRMQDRLSLIVSNGRLHSQMLQILEKTAGSRGE